LSVRLKLQLQLPKTAEVLSRVW